MGQFQPGTSLELTRLTEKRLNRLERRANPGGRLGDVETIVGQLAGRNRYINGRGRTNQRGYVSGTFLGPNAFSVDRLRVFSTQINLASNPTGLVQGVASTLGYSTSLGAMSAVSGLTIPGLPGVTTGVRATFSGASTLGITSDGAVGTKQTVVAGQTYTFSWYLFSTVAKTVTVNVQFRNASLGVVSVLTGTAAVLAANTWTRVSVSGVVPATAVYADPYSHQTSGAWASGNALTWTGLLIEPGSTLNAFYMPPKVDFTPAPQGQMLTLSGATFVQVIERENMEAGTYTVSWEGTSLVTLVNFGGVAPPFATSPATFTLDGLADVYVLITAGTIDKMQVEKGTVPTTFEVELVGDELAQCQRYYYQWAVNQCWVRNPYWNVALSGGGLIPTPHPVAMRAAPTVTNADGTPLLNFQMFLNTAGGGAAYLLILNSSDTRQFGLLASSSYNGGASLAANREFGYNNSILVVSAEL